MVVEQWNSCGSRVLADIDRHERELDGLCDEFRASNAKILEALGAMRQDLNERIAQQNQEIERTMSKRFERVNVEIASLRHAATWRASILGLAAGAIPAVAGIVYVMIRLAG